MGFFFCFLAKPIRAGQGSMVSIRGGAVTGINPVQQKIISDEANKRKSFKGNFF